MKRYISITGNRNPLDGDVLILNKVPPKTPYYSINIKILKHEKAYIQNRPLPKLAIRLKIGFIEAIKTFRHFVEGK